MIVGTNIAMTIALALLPASAGRLAEEGELPWAQEAPNLIALTMEPDRPSAARGSQEGLGGAPSRPEPRRDGSRPPHPKPRQPGEPP